jgi:hypothetical protein
LYVFDLKLNEWNMVDPDTARVSQKNATLLDPTQSRRSFYINPDKNNNRKTSSRSGNGSTLIADGVINKRESHILQ